MVNMGRILCIIIAWVCFIPLGAESRHSSHKHASTTSRTPLAEAIDSTPFESTISVHGDTLYDSLNLHWGMVSPVGTVLDKHYFVIDYNNRWKEPYWVAYHLCAADLSGSSHRKNNFRSDSKLPVQYRSELADYQRSGFDRGHNAPAADFTRSPEAMSQTFLLSNMSPQSEYLNRHIWEKLEGEVREEIEQVQDAWIVTGNLFMSPDSQPTEPTLTIGRDCVAVPDHCFKVVLLHSQDGSYSMFAFLIPNSLAPIPGNPSNYIVSVRRLEQISGYDFFPDLPGRLRDTLEAERPKDWPVRRR